jgi:hypothetical protein
VEVEMRLLDELQRRGLPWLISVSVYTLLFFGLTLAVEWVGRHFGWTALLGRGWRWTLAQSAVTGAGWGSLMTWLASRRESRAGVGIDSGLGNVD